jgi:hypothetical protein
MGTLPYYALFAAIGLAAALSANARVDRIVWFMAYVVFTVFVGLRHHVGMDWNNYLLMTDRIGGGSLMDGFRFAEPGFVIVTWLSDRLELYSAPGFCAFAAARTARGSALSLRFQCLWWWFQ